ncbi:MraY-like glycosyltransferase [Rubripirellula tenax]|uniref:MraY-like glycosyltransferase n=1 Tax=Rubripirellula tenax TaxID=2528015 RepID=A0A5C6F1C3_9BACT|nr:MraY-like glycosyltransferase [Rubripirellula tenax]
MIRSGGGQLFEMVAVLPPPAYRYRYLNVSLQAFSPERERCHNGRQPSSPLRSFYTLPLAEHWLASNGVVVLYSRSRPFAVR